MDLYDNAFVLAVTMFHNLVGAVAHGRPWICDGLLHLKANRKYVEVYNISYQTSPQIIERCQSLKEYSAFVHTVEGGLSQELPFVQAVAEAIRYCIQHNIMREYLLEHGSEVENMLLTEWNNDDALAVWKEEWRERFLEEGEQKGKQENLRANILALRDLLTPEVLAERLQVSLDEVLQIFQEAGKEKLEK